MSKTRRVEAYKTTFIELFRRLYIMLCLAEAVQLSAKDV